MQPRPETPASWIANAPPNPQGQAIRINGSPADEGAWWAGFRDLELSSLIGSAGGGNFDLREAVLRIAEAREQLAVAEADRYPTLGGNGSYTRQRFSETTAQGALFGKIGNIGSAFPGTGITLPSFPNPYDQFQLGFDASWEPDLFGRVRRSVEAADADMQASVEDSHNVLVSLESEIARNYIDLRGAQLKLNIARENLSAERDIVVLAQQRRQAGLTNEIDVHNAAAQATATEVANPAARTRNRCRHQSAQSAIGPRTRRAAGRIGCGKTNTAAATRNRHRVARRSAPPPARHSSRRGASPFRNCAYRGRHG